MTSFFEDWLHESSTHRMDLEPYTIPMERDLTIMESNTRSQGRIDPNFDGRSGLNDQSPPGFLSSAMPSPHQLSNFTFQFPPPSPKSIDTGRASSGPSTRSSPGKNETAAFNLLQLHSAEQEVQTPDLYSMDSDDTSVEEEVKAPGLVELSYQSLRRYESGWGDTAMTSDVLPRYQPHQFSYNSQASTRSSLSRRNSFSSVSTAMSSSTPSGRVRQHRPARTQREASILSASDSIGSRRTTRASSSIASVKPVTAVVKKPKVVKPKAEEEYYESEFEVDFSEESDGDDEFITGKRRTRTGSGGTKVARATRSNKRSTSGSAPPPASKRVKEESLRSEDPIPSSSGTTIPSHSRRTRNSTISSNIGNRFFPTFIEINPSFPRLYRNFPISSAFPADSFVLQETADLPRDVSIEITTFMPGAIFNKSPDPLNLYSPRFVKGAGEEKCGLCPICIESVARGGTGEEKWLKLKNSSYVYHMSNFHGISTAGIPFSPPLETRLTRNRTKAKDNSSGRATMTEGKCHSCQKWIPMLSAKNIEAVVPELLYWKHAKACHGSSTIEGETGIFMEDPLYALYQMKKELQR